MTLTGHSLLLCGGARLGYATLARNVVGTTVRAVTAIAPGSVALEGFGPDSLVETGASTVVVWELKGADGSRPNGQRRSPTRRSPTAPGAPISPNQTA